MFSLNTLCLVQKNILKNNEVYNMKDNGFVRVGALVNKLYLGNVLENAKEISKEIKKAYKSGISILVRPIKLENAESPILVTYSPSYLAGIIMSISIPIYSET